MRISAPLPLLLAALAAGCASAPRPVPGEDAAPGEVPSFDRFGSIRRDLETGAPVWVAPAGGMEARAPRFLPDGSVARDPATGAPLYEDRRGGVVARVLVALP
jgi:hypothetical protein